jgi:hypothetical protein
MGGLVSNSYKPLMAELMLLMGLNVGTLYQKLFSGVCWSVEHPFVVSDHCQASLLNGFCINLKYYLAQ